MDACELPDEPDRHSASKSAAANAALRYIEAGTIIGVGTGSTASAFIAALEHWKGPRPFAAVASSLDTAHQLRAAGIEVAPLPPSGRLPLYVDGADEVDPELRMLKGNGGAHTREKVLASAARTFICIADETKLRPTLVGQSVPVECVPMATAFVTRQIETLGGTGVPRPGFVTDNGNEVLDVHGIDLSDPSEVECRIDCIAGVVGNGIFAIRRADVVLVGHDDGGVDELGGPP